MKQKGFTLIELLVVIAIIGILASVVLASLNSARSKGNDAAIKSNLSNIRAQAEIFYDGNSLSYDGLCGNANVSSAVTAAGNASGITASCNASSTAWVVTVPLKSTPATYWCVDAQGASTGVVNGATSTSDFLCV